MIKWFAYIVLLLIIAPALLSAKDKGIANQYAVINDRHLPVQAISHAIVDTAASASKNGKHQDQDDKKKIKEIPKAKRESKPEKITDDAANAKKTKPKRERRPEGMERPPEIPRRSGD